MKPTITELGRYLKLLVQKLAKQACQHVQAFLILNGQFWDSTPIELGLFPRVNHGIYYPLFLRAVFTKSLPWRTLYL